MFSSIRFGLPVLSRGARGWAQAAIAHLGTFDRPLQDDELLPESQVLGRQRSPAGEDGLQERPDHSQDAHPDTSGLSREAGMLR